MSIPIIKCRKIADTNKRYKACLKLDSASDYKECFRLAWTLAQRGHAAAQNLIGTYFQDGTGVTQDYKQAFYWYLKSAEGGNIEALYNLGVTYYYGNIGVPKNPEKAFEYVSKAAERNEAESQHWLGTFYEKGEGTMQNKELSRKWYLKAAEQGLPQAEFAMSRHCDTVEKDEKRSAEWSLKAALQGHVHAMYNTAYDYRYGCGVKTNLMLAFRWYKKAAEKGDAESQYIIGSEYYNGGKEFFVVQNRALGLQWLRQSAENLFDQAHRFLANLKDEKDPDMLTHYHTALCFRHRWILEDDDDATNEKTFLKRASLAGYHKATLELAQLHERHARKWFVKANDRVSLSLSYEGLVHLITRTTHLPMDLSIVCLSFLEREISLYIRSRKRKRG